jgi:bifunctional lysine-specific demethylase and histidyl-hydroxylase MINA
MMAFDLERLLHPLDPQAFKNTYWEKQPLRLERNDADYYAELFSLKEFDRLLSQSRIRQGDIRILSGGKETPIDSLKDSGHNGSVGALEHLYAHYRDGRSIAVNGIGQCTTALADFCRSLAPAFSARVQINSYLSPAASQGLGTHYDTHDVFVLQIWGSKHWTLHEGGFDLPLLQQAWRRTNEPGRVVDEFDLQRGDLLYLPRGCVHTASSNSNASLHLTVGIHPIPWAMVMNGILQTAMKNDRRFRESLPLGFEREETARQSATARLSELLACLVDQVDVAAVIDDAAEAARRGTPPALDGHLTDLVAAGSIDEFTKLRQRPGIDCRLTEDDEQICLRFHGKEIKLPVQVGPALRMMAAGGCFSLADLPGELHEADRLVLAKSLLTEGFLTFAHSR